MIISRVQYRFKNFMVPIRKTASVAQNQRIVSNLNGRCHQRLDWFVIQLTTCCLLYPIFSHSVFVMSFSIVPFSSRIELGSSVRIFRRALFRFFVFESDRCGAGGARTARGGLAAVFIHYQFRDRATGTIADTAAVTR